MEFTAGMIAGYVSGRVEGDASSVVTTFSKIDEAVSGALTFLTDSRFTHYIYATPASVVLVDESIVFTQPVTTTVIRVANARAAIAQLLQLYEQMRARKTGIDATASIAATATLGADCYVGAYAVIGERCKIGRNCMIYPHAVLGDDVTLGDDCIVYPCAVVYYGCVLGNRVTLHAGSVIGADGFGFEPTAEGYTKIPQVGIVTIEDDVEIGANTCVDRSTMGSTYVRRGVKLDNLVQIAHNTDIGAHTVMSAQVGIAGSTTVGQWCVFAGQVGISGHITIGDKVMLGAKTGVPQSIKSGAQLIGVPPMPQYAYFKMLATLPHVADMYKQMRAMQREIDELKKALST